MYCFAPLQQVKYKFVEYHILAKIDIVVGGFKISVIKNSLQDNIGETG